MTLTKQDLHAIGVLIEEKIEEKIAHLPTIADVERIVEEKIANLPTVKDVEQIVVVKTAHFPNSEQIEELLDQKLDQMQERFDEILKAIYQKLDHRPTYAQMQQLLSEETAPYVEALKTYKLENTLLLGRVSKLEAISGTYLSKSS